MVLQGEVASCAGVTLYLWTVNGQPLAKEKAPLRPGGRLSCCCFFEVKDWDAQSLIVTGDTDGCVQVGPSKRENAPPPGTPCYVPGAEINPPVGLQQGQVLRRF